jgi:hypothetical protein
MCGLSMLLAWVKGRHIGFPTDWLEWLARTLSLPSLDPRVWLLELTCLIAIPNSTRVVEEPRADAGLFVS